MNKIQQFREYTRELECHLDKIIKLIAVNVVSVRPNAFWLWRSGANPESVLKNWPEY